MNKFLFTQEHIDIIYKNQKLGCNNKYQKFYTLLFFIIFIKYIDFPIASRF